MKIISIEAQNYMRFKELKLNLETGLHLISGYNYDEDTSNGSGKTSVLQVIEIAIFGETLRGLGKDEIINEDAGRNCFVKVAFSHNNEECTILRTRKPNDIVFTRNGVKDVGKDDLETQKRIQSFIGITHEAFTKSIYLNTSDECNFVALSDKDKQDLLTSLLDLTIFDKAYDRTSELLKSMYTERTEVDSKRKILESKVNQNTDFIKTLHQQSEAFAIQKEKDIETKKTIISNIQTNVNEVKKKIEAQIKELNKLDRPEAITMDFSLYDDELAEIKEILSYEKETIAERSKLDNNIFLEKNNIAKYKQEIAKFTNLEGNCTRCSQPITKEHVEKEIVALNELIKESESKLVSYRKALTTDIEPAINLINGAKERKEAIDDLKSKSKQERELEIIKFNAKEASIQKEIVALRKEASLHEESIARTIKEITDLTVKQNSFPKMIDKCAKEIAKDSEEHKVVSQSLYDINKNGEIVELLKKSYRNVKYYVFEQVVEEWNSKMDDLLKTLFNEDLIVEISTETETGKGEIKQKFSTHITLGDKKRSYQSLSEGEKQRVNLAGNFALNDVVQARSGANIDIMCLDEILSKGLDSEGAYKIVELLDKMKIDKKIYIIDHADYVKGIIDSEIKIERRNKISKIMEG